MGEKRVSGRNEPVLKNFTEVINITNSSFLKPHLNCRLLCIGDLHKKLSTSGQTRALEDFWEGLQLTIS